MRKRIFFILAVLLLFSGTAHALCNRSAAPCYEKEKDGWYYGEKLQGVDLQSFHLLFDPGRHDPEFADYAADKSHVYRGDRILPGVDPVAFRLLGYRYSRDATHVYYDGKLLSGADAKTFVEIANGSFKDAMHVYAGETPIKDADPATFSLVGGYPGLARDATHVFLIPNVMPDANPRDVKDLGRWYWASNKKIFFEDKPLVQADFATFHVAGDREYAISAEDENYYFVEGQALDKEECRRVGAVAIACKDYIFAAKEKYTAGIDPVSLRYLGRLSRMLPHSCELLESMMIYQDKNGVYGFYEGGPISRFTSFRPKERFETLDKDMESRLCSHPAVETMEFDNAWRQN